MLMESPPIGFGPGERRVRLERLTIQNNVVEWTDCGPMGASQVAQTAPLQVGPIFVNASNLGTFPLTLLRVRCYESYDDTIGAIGVIDAFWQTLTSTVYPKTPIGPVKLDMGYPLDDVPGEKKKLRFYFNISQGF